MATYQLSDEIHHGFDVRVRKDEAVVAAIQRTHGTVDVYKLADQLRTDERANGKGRPTGHRIIHPAKTSFILEHHPEEEAFRLGPRLGLDDGILEAPFLKASAASGLRLGWNGRGTTLRHPLRLRRR